MHEYSDVKESRAQILQSKSSANEKCDGSERHDTDVKRISARVAAKNLLFHETNTGFYACSKIERKGKKKKTEEEEEEEEKIPRD